MGEGRVRRVAPRLLSNTPFFAALLGPLSSGKMPLDRQTRRRILSYSVDWTLAIAFALFTHFFLDRFQQTSEFDLMDTSIQYEFKKETTIKEPALLGIFVVPYVMVAFLQLFFSYGFWWDLHSALLGLTIVYSVSIVFSQIVRVSVGRPRPDFISRCNPSPQSANAPVFGLTNISVCAQDTDLIVDGMRSFFSRESILVSGGMTWLSLFWAGKMGVFGDRRSRASYKLWGIVIPILVAVWVSEKQVVDHRHHVEDVVVGGFLGVLVAFMVYRVFYPGWREGGVPGYGRGGIAYPPRYSEVQSPAKRSADDRKFYPELMVTPLSSYFPTPTNSRFEADKLYGIK